MNAKIYGAVASILLSAAAAGHAYAADPAGAYKPPLNGFGQPDLSGTWSNETLTRMERPKDVSGLIANADDIAKLEGLQADKVKLGNSTNGDHYREECATAAGAFNIQCSYNQAFFDNQQRLMRVNGQPRTSFITSPADGRIPRRPDAPQRGGGGLGAGKADNPEDRSLPDRCLVGQNISNGALLNPTIYNNTWVFQQSKDTVVIVAEMSHDARTIRIGGQHDNIPRWFGDSIGHWEGQTLVVDTVHFHPEQLTYDTPALHLKERFTRVGPNRILYQFTIEDPGVYTQPWSGEYEFTTAKGLQYEYACHEGDYALEDILRGARREEAAAATKASGGQTAATAKQ